jgi:hypothetical protein
MNKLARIIAIGAATALWVYLLSPYVVSHFTRFHSHWIHFTGFGRTLLLAYAILIGILVISSLWFTIRKDYLLAIFMTFSVIVALNQYPKIKKFREVNMKPNKAMEPTPVSVTDHAPSSMLRATYLRGSSSTLGRHKMSTHCKFCKKEFGFFDRLGGTTTCHECYRKGQRPTFTAEGEPIPPSTTTDSPPTALSEDTTTPQFLRHSGWTVFLYILAALNLIGGFIIASGEESPLGVVIGVAGAISCLFLAFITQILLDLRWLASKILNKQEEK